MLSWAVSSISQIPLIAIVTLIALACSTPAFCGEIHDAAKSGDLAKVKALLKEKPKLVFNKDNKGWTPLHVAAEYDRKNKEFINKKFSGWLSVGFSQDGKVLSLHYNIAKPNGGLIGIER
jgi:hypothetical protein